MTKATERQITTALWKADGVVAKAAKALKMDRCSLHERIAKSPALKQVMADIDGQMVQLAEGNIAQHLRKGDKDITKFVLERRDRKRWGNRIDVGIDDATAEAIVAACGGDPATYRALLSQLGVAAAEIP